MLVIGIVGQPSSGKDTVAQFFSDKGFKHLSGGDYMRSEMRKQGLEVTRPNLTIFSTEMRKKYGLHYPYTEMIKEIDCDTVTSGMRNTSEIQALKNTFGKDFVLIAVEVSLPVRFERAKARGEIRDTTTFEKFIVEENTENNNKDGFHNVEAVLEMADYHIDNSGSEQELFKKIEEILAKITSK